VCRIIATRGKLDVGDQIRITVPPPEGEVHNESRETD
jgi:hypothetical protein